MRQWAAISTGVEIAGPQAGESNLKRRELEPAEEPQPLGPTRIIAPARPAAAGGLPRRTVQLKPPVFRLMPATAESAAVARNLARELIGEADPLVDAFVLCVSELVTNAVTHTLSAVPGGTITIIMCVGRAGAMVQVRDDGGPSTPRVLSDLEPYSEHGRGLQLVAALADHWGTVSTREGRVTWCRLNSD